MTALGDEPNTIGLALHAQAVAVVFDLMNQSGPAGTALPRVGRQNSNLCIEWRYAVLGILGVDRPLFGLGDGHPQS
jgi:hypothetical protein